MITHFSKCAKGMLILVLLIKNTCRTESSRANIVLHFPHADLKLITQKSVDLRNSYISASETDFELVTDHLVQEST